MGFADGWIVALIERLKLNLNEIVIIDTRDFGKAIAYVQLPFHVKAQIHGNWVSSRRLGDRASRPFLNKFENDFVRGKSSLDYIQ